MTFYRLLISLLAPVFLVIAIIRMGGLTARLGLLSPVHRGPRIWLHAASNGELNSAKPVIAALRKTAPHVRFLITTNSKTGRDMARDWNDPRIEAHLAPLDLRWIVRRVLRVWSIEALLIIENELWPNRISVAREQGCRIAVIGARMSEKSAKGWARVPDFAAQILGKIDWLSAQDRASQTRFTELGVDAKALQTSLNLKGLYQPPDPDSDLDALRPLYAREKTVLAASTHIGEDAIILDAFQAAQADEPDLHLILAPRHPQRRDEILSLIDPRFRVVQHSKREKRGPDTQITLADTMGDMPLWYELAGLCIVCGSFVKKGGHTPFEPAHFGSAILHGPHVSNFQEIYEMMDKEGAAALVKDTDELAEALRNLTASDQARMADLARTIIAHQTQADTIFEDLGALITPPF